MKLSDSDASPRIGEAVLANVLGHLPATTFRATATLPWRFLFLSGSHEISTGREVQAYLADGGFYFSLIHPDDRNRVLQGFTRAITDGHPHAAEYRIRHSDGGWRWARQYARTFYCEERAACFIDGLILDIAGVPAAVAMADERIRKSEALLQQIFDTSSVAIFLVNRQGTILRANRKMAQMFACDIGQLEGATYVSLIDPAEREVGQQNMLALLASDIDSVNLERLYQRRDGTSFWGNLAGRRFHHGDGDAERGLLGVIMDISERRRAEDEARQLAFYDPLTSLPNRRLLIERLREKMQACASGGLHGALVFIDLDNFKTLNDTLGHDVGDRLLKSVAQRLKAAVRQEDTVGRLGGDEFVVVLASLDASPLVAARMAHNVGLKIMSQLSPPHQLDRHMVRSTLSMGITLFRGSDAGIDELLKQADLAMYQAKASGRNTIRFFDPEMQERINARAQTESELYSALEKDELRLHLQPQVDLHGNCLGVEVLVRWQHPTRGLVGPLHFIPIAEESGQILALGHWVLRRAMQLQRAWQASSATRELVVAINISARQFHSGAFVEEIEDLLRITGADPTKLQFELTESIFLTDIDDAIGKMNTIEALGIGFALDDFGTGYSSLTYLKRLPLRQIKIDQAFVRELLTDPRNLAICRAIIVLARSLGLHVIAEGVESTQQWAQLRSDGCEEAQGYLFGRPMPEEAFMDWLAASTPGR